MLNLCCPSETIRYCCKYIESIHILVTSQLCYNICGGICLYVCVYVYVYTYVLRKSSDLKLEFRITYCKYDFEYTVPLIVIEIQILTFMLHMCLLLNYGFVNAVYTCVFCIVVVHFGKTVLLYCYANKSLESWILYSVCRHVCMKPLRTYQQLHTWNQRAVKFELKYVVFHLWKCFWKYQQNAIFTRPPYTIYIPVNDILHCPLQTKMRIFGSHIPHIPCLYNWY